MVNNFTYFSNSLCSTNARFLLGFKMEPDGATVSVLIKLKRVSTQTNTWCYMGIAQLFTNYASPVGFRENFYENEMLKFQLSIKKVIIKILIKVQTSEIFIFKV